MSKKDRDISEWCKERSRGVEVASVFNVVMLMRSVSFSEMNEVVISIYFLGTQSSFRHSDLR